MTLDWIPVSPYLMTMIPVTLYLMIVGPRDPESNDSHTPSVRAAPADFNKRIIFFTLIFRESPLHTDPPGFQPGAARELTRGGGGFKNNRGPRKRRFLTGTGALKNDGSRGWGMSFMLCTVVYLSKSATLYCCNLIF